MPLFTSITMVKVLVSYINSRGLGKPASTTGSGGCVAIGRLHRGGSGNRGWV